MRPSDYEKSVLTSRPVNPGVKEALNSTCYSMAVIIYCNIYKTVYLLYAQYHDKEIGSQKIK